ncbi:MAG: DUF484 family protein [Pseudomonadota bacterium]
MTTSDFDVDQIRAWLEQHPDVLDQHPDFFDHVELPDNAASVTSLIGYQNKRLMQQNRALSAQLKTLSGIAGQNEKLMQRLHRLTLNLTNTHSLNEFIEQLNHALLDDFQADAIRLILNAVPESVRDCPTVLAFSDDPPEWLQRLLQSHTPFCGRLTQQKRDQLLGEDANTIVSAALVPLGERGLLLIGAQSEDRFHPDMGTLFLDLLGETVRLRLDVLSQSPRPRRSA